MNALRVWLATACIVFTASWAAAQDFDTLVPGSAAKGGPAAHAPVKRPAAANRPQAPAGDPTEVPGPQAGDLIPPAQNQSGPVTVRTSLSRTAVWVGEPVVYTVDVTCPPGSDIMAADLSRDRLRLSGLEVVDVMEARSVSEDGTKHYRSDFRLVSYAIGGSVVGLEPQPIRYVVHSAGQAPDTLVPADEVRLSAVKVAVRSVLPDADVTWIRDTRPAASMPSMLGYLVPAGWTLIAVSIVPLALAGVVLAGRRVPPRVVRRQPGTAELRARIAELRAFDLGDVELRRHAFAVVNEVIRVRLDDEETPALALTTAELEPLIESRSVGERSDALAALQVCEKALYGGPGHLPPSSAAIAALDCAEQLLSAKVR